MENSQLCERVKAELESWVSDIKEEKWTDYGILYKLSKSKPSLTSLDQIQINQIQIILIA